MKELGMVLLGCLAFTGFFAGVIYPDLEVKGYSNIKSCNGECYEAHVAKYGTVVEIERAKAELANADVFSSIRGAWAGCAACHGNDGKGIGAFPALAGRSSDYIVEALTQYKNGETRGAMSGVMWGQSSVLSDADIQTLGDFVEAELK